MSTFSLLQLTLDQTISREDMETAADVLETLARPDIAKLHRELFGIVATGLRWEEANAFQQKLARASYPTEIVLDEDVPYLPHSYAVQRIGSQNEMIEFTDSMGRQQVRLWEEVVFLAGGFLTETEEKIEKSLRRELSPSTQGASHTYIHRESKREKVQKFRLDFFFASEPYRLHVLVIPENVAFYQESPLRLRHPGNILQMCKELRNVLPPERLTSGMFCEGTDATYPNTESYEEEIRWRFHRLLK